MASSSSHSGAGFDTFFNCFLCWRELKINLLQSCSPAHSVWTWVGFFLSCFCPVLPKLAGLRLFQSRRGHPSGALPSPLVGPQQWHDHNGHGEIVWHQGQLGDMLDGRNCTESQMAEFGLQLPQRSRSPPSKELSNNTQTHQLFISAANHEGPGICPVATTSTQMLQADKSAGA